MLISLSVIRQRLLEKRHGEKLAEEIIYPQYYILIFPVHIRSVSDSKIPCSV